jgi:nucleotide-binding universal stress UspA family protein
MEAAGPLLSPAGHDTVLVPVDGSELSERALGPALWLAGRLGAEVHAITVTHGDDGGWHSRYERELGDRWPDVLAHHLARPTVVAGIEAMVEKLPGSLVCMATDGRARAAALVPSMFTSVARTCARPLVAVGPEATVPQDGVERLVACVDGTSASEQALRLAAGWARRLGAQLDLVAVATPPSPLHIPGDRRHPSWLTDPSAYLAELTGRDDLAGLHVGVHALFDPIGPAQALADHLYWDPATLVVVASHLRTHLDRALHGSTTARIVRACPVPVLVQPAFEPAVELGSDPTAHKRAAGTALDA